MDKLNLRIFSATAKKPSDPIKLRQSLKDFGLSAHFEYENSRPLAQVYNEAIVEARDTGHEGLLLVHDDVWMEEDPGIKLKRLFEKWDVVGVAGCSRATVNSPALWNMMGAGNLHGAVAHSYGAIKHMTSFGPYPSDAVLIDGVFIALNRKALESGVTFDERCPSFFHFYDLLFSTRVRKRGLKLGVGDVTITHDSPGLSQITEDWRVGEKYFFENVNA